MSEENDWTVFKFNPRDLYIDDEYLDVAGDGRPNMTSLTVLPCLLVTLHVGWIA
ncbi:MAG: hypothetical protein OER96_00645 [Gammaproteobacteria bacterium]|nr:hypothetical protein [Gammaproteobacteria bacterium]